MVNTVSENTDITPLCKRRVEIYDALRGIAIIYMVFYHSLFDFQMLGYAWADAVIESQRVIVTYDQGLFIILSGICCSYSRNNALRGAKLLGVSMLFTLATVLVDYRISVTFGILHLLSFSMLIFASCDRWLKKLPPIPFALLSFLVYSFTYNVRRGWFGFGELRLPVPEMLSYNNRLYIFGFADGTYPALDFFPLLPYLFLFLEGAFLGMWLVKRKLPEFCYKKVPVLGFLGKHSLFIYVIHQPILYGLLYSISLITNRT